MVMVVVIRVSNGSNDDHDDKDNSDNNTSTTACVPHDCGTPPPPFGAAGIPFPLSSGPASGSLFQPHTKGRLGTVEKGTFILLSPTVDSPFGNWFRAQLS